MDVKDLIKSCLQHNRSSEKLLFERYVAHMAHVCMRYLKDEAEVQDVLSEGFMKVFEKLKTFEYREEHGLEAWIRRIIVNECLMRLRSRNRLLDSISEETSETAEPAQNDVEAKEIVMLMQRLPAGCRTVLNMYVIDGFSHKEIAALLGITESASRSQLTHARNKLKNLLKTHGWNGMIN